MWEDVAGVNGWGRLELLFTIMTVWGIITSRASWDVDWYRMREVEDKEMMLQI